MSVDTRDEWFPVSEAFPLLKRYFRTEKTLRHHLWRRDLNGLTAAGAVRMTPFKRLLVNPEKVRAWAMGEVAKAAA
jgi:hypothetical protein